MILQAFIRGALIIAIAALLTFLLRNRSAALRHHVWATAVVVQLALLAFIPVLPTINLPILPTITAEIADDAETIAETTSTQEPSAPVLTQSSQALDPRIAQPPKRPRTINWPLTVWLAGAILVLIRYLTGTALMARIAYKGARVEDGEWLVLAQRTARELGITRPVTMIWGDKVSVPITWGVLYPMILLPASAQEWPFERRRFVLVHEMAHVKRFDALTQLLAQLTTAVFWFSPFVWIAEWRMRIEREHACDDTVLQHGTEPTLYADELLQMVRSLVRRRSTQPAFAALAMARKSEFEGRMLAILDPERPRAVTGITSGVMFALLSLLIAAPVAAIDPFAVRVVTTPEAATNSPLPPLVKAAGPAPVARVAMSQPCSFDPNHMGTTANVSDDDPRIDVRLRRADVCMFVDLQGGVRLSPNEQRILAVPAGGNAIVREVTRSRETVLSIEHSSTGDLRRSFTVNGQVPDDDGATERSWLARVLPQALAEGSINTPARVARLLKSHGLAGTLSDIAALQSPAARRLHYIALIKANEWSDSERARISGRVLRSLSGSDREAVMKLLPGTKVAATSTSQPQEVKTDTELLEKILFGLTSSNDLRMAMQSQLAKADRSTLLMFARQTSRMSAGYEAAEFLLFAKVNYLHHGDEALAQAWFTSASQILSSWERRRVLTAVLEYVQGNEGRTLMLLKATANMSSGVDKAAVLAAVGKAKLVFTPALRTAFLLEVNTISSATDRRTILEALQ
jgi:beta-lactamase regulating signal transducer with metallopeptidase domain